VEVKNNKKNPVQFGNTLIPPGETGRLIPPFSKDHPTIEKYLVEGWLEKVDTEDDSPDGDNTEGTKPIGSMTRQAMMDELAANGAQFSSSAPAKDLRELVVKLRTAQE